MMYSKSETLVFFGEYDFLCRQPVFLLKQEAYLLSLNVYNLQSFWLACIYKALCSVYPNSKLFGW